VVQWFLSVDPLTSSYPELTPYQFASNQPIWAIDLDGLERTVTVFINGSEKPIFTLMSEEIGEANVFGTMNSLMGGHDPGGTPLVYNKFIDKVYSDNMVYRNDSELTVHMIGGNIVDYSINFDNNAIERFLGNMDRGLIGFAHTVNNGGLGIQAKGEWAGFSVKGTLETYSTTESDAGLVFGGALSEGDAFSLRSGKGFSHKMADWVPSFSMEFYTYVDQANAPVVENNGEIKNKVTFEGKTTSGLGESGLFISTRYNPKNETLKIKTGCTLGWSFRKGIKNQVNGIQGSYQAEQSVKWATGTMEVGN